MMGYELKHIGNVAEKACVPEFLLLKQWSQVHHSCISDTSRAFSACYI